MNKIAISGSHSTGKTSLLNKISKEYTDYTIISEIARDLMRKKGKLPQNMNKEEIGEFQKELLNNQIKEEQVEKFISDRSIIDILAYTKLGVTEDVFNELKNICLEYLKTKPYDVVVYIPIEFQIQQDGIRFEGEVFRKEVDKTILSLFSEFNIQYITITGDIDERVEKIKYIINKKTFDK